MLKQINPGKILITFCILGEHLLWVLIIFPLMLSTKMLTKALQIHVFGKSFVNNVTSYNLPLADLGVN